jgi:hypothetical protein
LLFALETDAFFEIQASWNGDSQRILTWNQGVEAMVWDAVDGSLLFTLYHESPVREARWNNDGTRIVTWADESTAYVWDAADGTWLFTLYHDTPVRGASWSGDEGRILTWAEDIRVWDAADGSLLFDLTHVDSIRDAVWSGDGNRVLTLTAEQTVQVWDVINGRLLFAIPFATDIEGAVWSADDSRILTWSQDGTVNVWMVDLDQLVTLGDSLLYRPLNNEERAEFFLPTLAPTPTPTVPPVTARTATVGAQRGEIPVGGWEAWHYEGQAGEVLTIRLEADSPADNTDQQTRKTQGLLDTLLVLSTLDGEVLAEVDDIETSTVTNSAIENFTLPSDATYLIQTRSYNDATAGAYTLIIESSLEQ